MKAATLREESSICMQFGSLGFLSTQQLPAAQSTLHRRALMLTKLSLTMGVQHDSKRSSESVTETLRASRACRRAAASSAEHAAGLQGCRAPMLRRRRVVPPQQRGGLPWPAAGGSGCYSGPAGVPLPPGRLLTPV